MWSLTNKGDKTFSSILDKSFSPWLSCHLPLLCGRFGAFCSADNAGTTNLFTSMPLVFDAVGSTAGKLRCNLRPTVQGMNE